MSSTGLMSTVTATQDLVNQPHWLQIQIENCFCCESFKGFFVIHYLSFLKLGSERHHTVGNVRNHSPHMALQTLHHILNEYIKVYCCQCQCKA